MAGFHEDADFPAVPNIFRTTFEFRFRPSPNSARNLCVMKDDFELPPPPSPLTTDDELYRESAIKSTSTANHNRAVQSDNDSEDFVFLSNLPPFARLRILKRGKCNKNVQVPLNSSRTETVELVELDSEWVIGHLDPKINDARGFQGDQEQFAETKIASPEKSSLKSLKKRGAERHNRCFGKPQCQPRHGRIVQLTCDSSSIDSEWKMTVGGTHYQAIQNGDVTDKSPPLGFKGNRSLQGCGGNSEDQDATSFGNSSEEIFSPCDNNCLNPPNFSKRLLVPRVKIQAENDKTHLIERATSPVIFNEESNKYRFNNDENQESPVNTNGDGVYNKSARTLRKGIAQKTPKEGSPSTQDSMIVVVATPPSPVLVCSVIKSSNAPSPSNKTSSPNFTEPPKYMTGECPQPRHLDDQKSVAYATILASESIDCTNDANVVIVDGMSPLSSCPFPSSQSPRKPHLPCPPTLATCQKSFRTTANKNLLWYSRKASIPNIQLNNISYMTPTTSSGCDRTLSNRELVSSVSSGHRPFPNTKSSPDSVSSKFSGSGSSKIHCSSRFCQMSRDYQVSNEKRLFRTGLEGSKSILDKVTFVESRSPLIDAFQAIPEKGSFTSTFHLPSAKQPSPPEAKSFPTPHSFRSDSTDEGALSCIPDRYQKQVVQEWLVNRVSANVAMHFGSKLSQMFLKSDSQRSNTSKESNYEVPSANSASSPLNKVPVIIESSVPDVDTNGKQSQVKLRKEKSFGPGFTSSGLNQKPTTNSNFASDHSDTSRRNHLNQVSSKVHQQQQRPFSRMCIRPLPKHEVHSGIGDKDHHPSTCSFPFEQIIEVDPRDELVYSHQNPHDRRLKAASMKTGCYLNLKGPLKLPTLDGTLRRDREFYELIIGAPSKEKADRCINYLRETFPRTVLQKKTTRALFNKIW